jgi:hypothetical protein
VKLRRLLAKVLYVFFVCVWFEKCMVYQTGPVPGRTRLAEHQTYAGGASIHDPVHPLGAAIEAFMSASAQRTLFLDIAIQPRDYDVGDLLDQMFKIAII